MKPTADIMSNAQVLWDFNRIDNTPQSADIVLGLGSHDLGVADRATELYTLGIAPLVVFSGANAPTTVEIFPNGEAVAYKERAEKLGVPRGAILIEQDATNTAENFTFSRKIIGDKPSNSIVVVTRPYQQRRALATARRLWPQPKWTATAQKIEFEEYTAIMGWNRVINMLVGDTQRLWTIPRIGHAVPENIPNDVLQAFNYLVDKGYTTRVDQQQLSPQAA